MKQVVAAPRWRLLLALSWSTGGLPAGRVQPPSVSIDSPAADERVALGQTVRISGWAADPTASATAGTSRPPVARTRSHSFAALGTLAVNATISPLSPVLGPQPPPII